MVRLTIAAAAGGKDTTAVVGGKETTATALDAVAVVVLTPVVVAMVALGRGQCLASQPKLPASFLTFVGRGASMREEMALPDVDDVGWQEKFMLSLPTRVENTRRAQPPFVTDT